MTTLFQSETFSEDTSFNPNLRFFHRRTIPRLSFCQTPRCSLHNLLIYRDPGHLAKEVSKRAAAESEVLLIGGLGRVGSLTFLEWLYRKGKRHAICNYCRGIAAVSIIYPKGVYLYVLFNKS